jgi:hypothetical protein
MSLDDWSNTASSNRSSQMFLAFRLLTCCAILNTYSIFVIWVSGACDDRMVVTLSDKNVNNTSESMSFRVYPIDFNDFFVSVSSGLNMNSQSLSTGRSWYFSFSTGYRMLVTISIICECMS